MNRCDICIEESCKGKHDCKCDTCNRISECPRFLHAIIRITNRCTQSCSHCCFSSSPRSSIMMSVSKAKQVSTFLETNRIPSINIMGGEFFCNPDWYEILTVLTKATKSVRLVTNGDWACSEDVKEKLSSYLTDNINKVRVALSMDMWHTNANVQSAREYLEKIGCEYKVATAEETTPNSVVPVGRGQFHPSIYSMVGCYCGNPIHKYSFLIDELGVIYKCGFGVLNYATVDDYLEGGFRKRFKEFNTKFYSIFILSCSSCIRVMEDANRCVSRE